MECDKHKDRVILHAFSTGKCNICNKEIITSHIPCDKVCDKCSKEYNICKICGDKIK